MRSYKKVKIKLSIIRVVYTNLILVLVVKKMVSSGADYIVYHLLLYYFLVLCTLLLQIQIQFIYFAIVSNLSRTGPWYDF